MSSRDAVIQAVAEYDAIGQPAFLAKYGFKPSNKFVLRWKNRSYDSKAIVGVAHGLEFPEEGPLLPGQLSGGLAPDQAGRKLLDLGFDVVDVGAKTNPPWNRAETILAYELFKRIGAAEPNQDGVIQLSHLLRTLNLPESDLRPSFRNAPGVAMKLKNLQWFDSEMEKGLQGGSQVDREIVEEFRNDLERLAAEADRIRAQQAPARSAWIVRAWDGTAIRAQEFQNLGRVVIGYVELGNLSGLSRADLRAALDLEYAGRPEGARGNWLDQLDNFVNRMQIGDVVVTPSTDNELLVGKISGRYDYVDRAPFANWRHTRPVQWVTRILRGDLPAETQRTLGTPMTVVRFPNPGPLFRIADGQTSPPILHLLLKWRMEEEPRTVALHREIAEDRGFVWWGKLGDPQHTSMSDEILQRYRDQLNRSIATHVYLYRPGEVWRTRMLEITKNAADIDVALVPQYWRNQPCNLWVRITDFEPLDPDWVLQNLDPAGPRSAGSPMASFVRGRNSVLYVREREEAPPPLPPPPPTPPPARLTVEQVQRFCAAQELLIPDSVIATVIAAIHSSKHVILTGPPGTGKTTLAQAVVEAAREAGACRGGVLTTATADWTTYETIGGLRPMGPHGELRFSEGHFLDAINKGHWLVIDELNRSNFDRAFGQLFTVLSGQTVVLPYDDAATGKPIALVPEDEDPPSGYHVIDIPKSWQLIATMNVFDKSLLFEMSFALMRRFAFIEVPAPSDETYRQLIEREASGSGLARSVGESLLGLRTVKELGPAVFMDLTRFSASRIALGHISEHDLAYQCFYSYLLPQFEGIDEQQGGQLWRLLKPRVGSENHEMTRRTLRDVLGLELRGRLSLLDDEDLGEQEEGEEAALDEGVDFE